MVDGWRHLCAEIYCLNSKSSAAPSMSRRSSLRNCSFISLLSKRPLIWNALLSECFSPNIGGSKGTLLGLGRVPMGCKCLTISLGSVRSNCAGGSLVCATSWADLDLLATGARFFTVAAFFLAAGAFLAGSGFFAGCPARYWRRACFQTPQALPPARCRRYTGLTGKPLQQREK